MSRIIWRLSRSLDASHRRGIATTARIDLYNAALDERRGAYRMAGKSLNYYDQQNQLRAIKEVRPDLESVHSQVLQDVLKRVDKAFQGFFRRVKVGVKAGFPASKPQPLGQFHLSARRR